MTPISLAAAHSATARLAGSALPDAPVVSDEPRRGRSAGRPAARPVRRSVRRTRRLTAGALHRAANRIAPA